jgi:hypothetical protein
MQRATIDPRWNLYICAYEQYPDETAEKSSQGEKQWQ